MYNDFDTDKREFERFMSKVDKRRNGEWIWKGSTTKTDGVEYGVFYVRSLKTSISATRYMYRYIHGSIPEGNLIIHFCDNTLCVNPAHLFATTPFKNSTDMVQKGRSLMGQRNPSSILTDEKVLNIRKRYLTDVNFNRKEVAEEHEVCPETIYNVINWNTWKHLDGYPEWIAFMNNRVSPDMFHRIPEAIRRHSLKDCIVGSYRNASNRVTSAKITEEDVITVTTLRNRGYRYTDIQEEYANLTASALRKVATGVTWKNVPRTIAATRTIDKDQNGIHNPNARLKTRQVKRIRRLYLEGIKVSKIHAKYPVVSYTQVHRIVKRKAWNHI